MAQPRSNTATPAPTVNRFFLGAITLAFTAILTACSPGPPPEPPPGSVVLIGLDGFEWKVALDLLRENKLPTIAGLMRQGTFGELTVTHPTLSPIIWTSIATGVEAERHGIYGFVKEQQKAKKRDGQLATLFTSADRRVKALWNIFSDAGRTNHTIGWWMTFPAESVHGTMVAQVNTITPQMRRDGIGIWKGQLVQGLEGQIFPETRTEEILSIVPEVEDQVANLTKVMLGGVSQSVGDTPKALLEQSFWAFRADAIYRRVGTMLLDEDEPFDLFSIYFGGADVVGHRFLRYTYPTLFKDKPNQDTLDAVGELLRNYYIYLDTVIADLLSRVPPGTTTILVSDHGMSPIHRRSRFSDSTLSGGHLKGPAAFFVASGPAIKKANHARSPENIRRRYLPKLGSILDIAPTVLALRGLPVGRDMQGKPMEHILDPAFLEKYPVRRIGSHTERNWFESRKTTMVGDVDPTERLEQLRTLGYLD